MTFLFAVLSSAVFGLGVALQQRPARSMPSDLSGRPTILLGLVRRPIWVLGVLAEITGFGLQVVALQKGSLVVVQPVLAVSLLFTIGLAALWSEATISVVEWAAVGAVVAGLAVFLVLASPRTTGGANASTTDWLATLLSLALGVAGFVFFGLRASGTARGVLFGAAAGIADATMAVVTKAFATDIDQGAAHVMTSWTPYTMAIAGILAMTVSQSAYQAAQPTVSLPIITVTDPVISCVVGIVVFGEVIHINAATGPVAVLALVVMAAGLVVLSRSHNIETPAQAAEVPEPSAAVKR